MLYVFGLGEVPISISGNPTCHDSWTHTIRGVGAVTRGLDTLQEGDTLGLRGPFGSAWPVDDARGRDLIIMAGGIGLAPLRPALLAALADRQAFGRIILLYGARSPEDLLYVEQLHEWRARFDLDIWVTVDRAAGEWHGHVGVVTTLIPTLTFAPDNCLAMICGPEIMMRFCVQELQRRGVSDESIYVSMERNMKCAIGHCGHCQFGADFVCKDGPVFRYDQIATRLRIPQL
ncbi:MAG: NAD(P)H-flavin reductase [Rhodothermales bacterium]|jgi:NAD(P)H-flavin reductase